MTSLHALELTRRRIIDDLKAFASDLDESIIINLFIYAQCLVVPNTDEINESTFLSEMVHQFDMTNRYMLSLMLNAVRLIPPSHTPYMNLQQYCKLLCVLLTKNMDVKVNFVFSVYDHDHDGFLRRNEVYAMLNTTITTDDDDKEESMRELIDLVLKVVDANGDGNVSPEEFRELVKKNSMYLELLGPCLSDEKCLKRFLNKVQNKSIIQIRNLFLTELEQRKLGPRLEEHKRNPYYPVILEM